VLYDTKADKKLAFKMGQRPFQSVVCEGVEEGLKVYRGGALGSWQGWVRKWRKV
jgi:hypothetical protein